MNIALIAGLACTAWAAAQPASTVRTDEHVVVFPALASPTDAGWRVEVHGWIFEPETDSNWRQRAIAALGAAAPCEGEAEETLFRERVHPFIVDNERGKAVPLRIRGVRFVSQPSESNGHFRASVELPAAVAGPRDGNAAGTLKVTVDLPDGDQRRFEAPVHTLEAGGISVICDIDDTVRISNVGDPAALLAGTFCTPFRVVPPVRAVLLAEQAKGAAVHYVSASPWQLYEPLHSFMREQGLPDGSFHLKSVRLKDGTFADLFKDARAHKTPIIDGLMARWPERRFVLIGDGGEDDPELYGDLARRWPERVVHVYIRETRGLRRESGRYAAAFAGVDPGRWTLIEPEQK